MTSSLDRVLPLAGGCNFRDLGGYRTGDGRRIRPGRLFRSGVMSYLTPGDHLLLTRLKIRTVCDLRRADERKREPTRWPGDVDMIAWDEAPDVEARSELPWANSTNEDQARDVMITLYRAMPEWLRNRIRGLFEQIARGRTPLLFNCAAGKDRTGLSAALVLHTLGVPRETILADYELTNRAVNLPQFILKHHRAALGLTNDKHPLLAMNPGVRDAIMRADRAYLAAALEQIEIDYGSLDGYLRDVLNVSDRIRNEIRNALLSD